MSAITCARKVIFLSRLLSCHVLERPHNGAVVRRCVFSTDPTYISGHCKRYRATGPHRAGVDMDMT